MAQVSVNIGGRAYRLACEPGQEARLEGLAHALDEKIAELRKTFGEIGDQRLVVMAALSVADEAAEAEQRVNELEAKVEGLLAQERAARRETDRQAETITQTLGALTARLTTVAQTVAPQKP